MVSTTTRKRRFAVRLLMSALAALFVALVALPARAYAVSDPLIVSQFDTWEEFNKNKFKLDFDFYGGGHDYVRYEMEVLDAATYEVVGTVSDRIYLGDDYIRTVGITVDASDWEPGRYAVFAKTYYYSDYGYGWLGADLNDQSSHGYVCGLFTYRKNINNKALKLTKTSFTYNGKVQRPKVKTVGGKTLKAGTDYTIKYSNKSSKNVGTYTVTVVGKGDYVGTSKKATYKIVKAANGLTVKANKIKVKAGKSVSAKKAFVVTKATGDVTFTKTSGNAKILVSKKGKVTVKKGLAAGNYKVRVKVRAAGSATRKAASKIVTLQITVK